MIGNDFYISSVEIEVPVGSSKTVTHTFPIDSFAIENVIITAYEAAVGKINNDSVTDLITITMNEVGGADYKLSTNAIDIWQLHEIGKYKSLEGFITNPNARYEITLNHDDTYTNIVGAIIVKIAFVGNKVKI